ncbi:hypothetical protein DFP73DRAFT_326001 [Morchella snyderi]|nr:hypothetical protein DFP73DRAFT_326001 [Morchella snyderi]
MTGRDHTHDNLPTSESIRIQAFSSPNMIMISSPDDMIRFARDSIARTTTDNPGRAGMLFRLSGMLDDKFRHTRNPEDLSQVKDLERQALSTAEIYNPNLLPAMHSRLAVRLEIRLRVTRDAHDLDSAILHAQHAAEMTSVEDTSKAHRMGTWSSLLGMRYDRASDARDIEKALEVMNEVVKVAREDDNHRADYMRDFAIRLVTRFDKYGAEEDIQNAIEWAERALITPGGNKMSHWETLGNLLETRYKLHHDIKDLDRSIKLARKITGAAMSSTSTVTPFERERFKMNLAPKLCSLYERSGDLSILDEAIDNCSSALRSGHLPNSDIYGRLQSMLSNFLDFRYARKGEIEDMQLSITLARNALCIIDPGHEDRFPIFLTLAMRLERRYKHIGALDDLLSAITFATQACDGYPLGNTHRPNAMNNLGNMLERLYMRTSEMRHLDEAIRRAKQAAEAVSLHCYNQLIYSSNLSNKLRRRYELLGRSSDIDEAVKYAQQALDGVGISEEHSPTARAKALANLSIALADQAVRGSVTARVVEGLERVIEIAREAVEITPQGIPDIALYLHNLACYLHIKHQLVYRKEDEDEILRLLTTAFKIPQVDPTMRIRVARRLIDVLVSAGRWLEASQVATEAIELLPLLSPRVLGLPDQQETLKEYVGFASYGAAICLEAGEPPSNAVRLLEIGRGIITGSRFADRTSLDILSAEHPDLAAELEQLRSELTIPPVPFAIKTNSWATTDRRIIASRDLTELLVKIRRLPGFESFLCPPDEEQQKEAASSGTIIIINVSSFRCDALLITTSDVTKVALPRLSNTKINLEVENLRAERGIVPLFEWLWDDVASIILDGIGYRSPFSSAPSSVAQWPRVWWILTGPLSHLPVHAAGYHSAGPERTVIDRVVSSYAPSLKALMYSREGIRPRDDIGAIVSEDTALLVSMESTPGLDSLPYVSTEVKTVSAILNPAMQVCEIAMPSSEAVRDTLMGCRYFHFAGHGESNPRDPSASCVLLRGGEARRVDGKGSDGTQSPQDQTRSCLSVCLLHRSERGGGIERRGNTHNECIPTSRIPARDWLAVECIR